MPGARRRAIVRVPLSCLLAAALIAGPCIRSTASAQEEGPPALKRIWPDNLFDIGFLDPRHGLIAADQGRVLVTADGGQHWDLHYVGRNELLRRAVMVDPQHLWAVGSRGSIFASSDGGATWQVQHEARTTLEIREKTGVRHEEVGVYLRDVGFADRRHGWVVGHEGLILHTADGGQSWQAQKLPWKRRDPPRLHAVAVVDPDTALVAGEFGLLAWTTDAGATWTLIKHRYRATLLDVAAVDGRFIAVGTDGTVLAVDPSALAPAEPIAEGAPAPRPPKAVRRLKNTSRENLFAVTALPGGGAVLVGRASLLRLSGDQLSSMDAAVALEVPFKWFHGVAVRPDGGLWAVGIRGTVIRADGPDAAFRPELNIGHSERVVRRSSRWETRS